MPRETIPKKPRFDFVTQTAYKFLLECGYTKFPISPYDVLDKLKDYVVCLPWSKAKAVMKSEDPFHLRKLKAEGRTIRIRETGTYYIIYDDVTISSHNRISWTIMHEIGHVILGHLVEFTETSLQRGGITKDQYGVLEVEANHFAAEFLMPTAALKLYSEITVDEISLLFGVSEEAARKKYKRIFGSNYLPFGDYGKQVFRNFFSFLMNDADEAIYKSIYKQWGLPWKAKYVSVRRKCPNCRSYIDDPKANFCCYCGSKIEQPVMYRNMSERLDTQNRLANESGTNHIKYPCVETVIDGSLQYQKVTVCPVCLNHDFTNGAAYCRICGTPIKNGISEIEACFSKEDGKETNSNSWYPKFEKRYRNLVASKDILNNDELVVYDYWEFTKHMMYGSKSGVSMNLQPALLYSRAFSDDNDDIYIVTDTNIAAEIIKREKEVVLKFLKETDNIKRNCLEVFVVNEV